MKNKFFTIILAAVASLFAATTALAQSGSQSVNIKVENPGELSSLIMEKITNVEDVNDLTISGTLNDQDMALLSSGLNSLSNLTSLDLSGTNITEAPNCKSLKYLKTVKLPETVTSVGNSAFYECSALTSISLPNATSIGSSAFSSCSALTSISLPNATSIGNSAFYYCSALTSISLPNATSIGSSAFGSCYALTSISLPNATFIGYSAFYYCSALTSIELPNVTSVGNETFKYCKVLKSVSLPNATSIGSQAFYGCSALTSIELPNATSIGRETFYKCSALKSISLPNATSIGYSAFYYCSALTSIELPKTTSIDSGAFSACSALTSINMPKVETIYSKAFYGCSALTSIELSSKLTTLEYDAFDGCSKIKDVYCHRVAPITTNAFSSVPFGATLYAPAVTLDIYKSHSSWNKFYNYVALNDSVNSVNIKVENPGELASLVQQQITDAEDVYILTISGTLNEQDMYDISFQDLTNLAYLDLSETNITSIGECSGLTNLVIVKLPKTVTSIHNFAFDGCSALTSIELPNVTSIGNYAFYNCSSLTSIELTDVTSIGERAFAGCALTSIELPNATSIGSSAFSNCPSLTSIDLPNVTSIGDYAFYYCSALTSIELPNATSIGSSAFYECSALTSVELPNATSIGDYAFYECSALTSVELPNATSIGERAFYFCSSLTSIELSGKLTTIGSSAFSGCSKLKEVYCHRVYPFTTDAFSSISSGATLYAPAITLDLYKSHSSWSRFSNYVGLTEPISDLMLDGALSLTSTEGFEDKISLTLDKAARLSVAIDSTLNVSDFQMNVDYDNYTYSNYQYNYHVPTLVNNSPIIADNVSVKMTLRTGKWYFLSMPFDFKVGNIEKEDGVYWVVRKYSGANRASGEGKTWLTLTDNDTIKAGEGFILQCSRDYYSSGSYPTFTFHAIDNAKKNNIFTTENVSQPLTEYASASAANRSWNLIGNPYPSYFNTRYIEEEAIVTVWNGYNYNVYSTLDDNHMLRPFEAYFVQRPANVQDLTHPAEYRSMTDKINYGYAKPRQAQMKANRKVYNFMLTGEEMSDRARIVVNPEAQEGYEVGRDAAKFASLNADAPQLFVNRNGSSLAIDESPLESGKAKLGISSVKTNQYTISLSAINSSESVMLTDNVTGTTTDLTTSDYTFTAQPGTNASRFTVSFGTVDGISNVNDNDNVNDDKAVYDLTGRRMAKTVKGLNIVNHRKIIVK